MVNRKRNIQLKIWLTEEERRLIDEKMKLLPTSQIGAYIRKMAIDGYIIYTDTANIKGAPRNRPQHKPDCKARQFHRRYIPRGYYGASGKARRDMAITKNHPINATLKKAVDYICNPAKTDGTLLVYSYGCAPETADIEFAWTREKAREPGPH